MTPESPSPSAPTHAIRSSGDGYAAEGQSFYVWYEDERLVRELADELRASTRCVRFAGD